MKKYLICFFIWVSLFLSSQEKTKTGYYAVITNFKSVETKKIAVYLDKEEKDVVLGGTISAGSTIVTFDNQSAEITIYKNSEALTSVYIKENSDFTFSYDEKNNLQIFNLNYGSLRIVSSKTIPGILTAGNLKINFTNTDFIIVSITDADKSSIKGQLSIFDNEIKVTSGLKNENSTILKKMQTASIADGNLNEIKTTILEDLKAWKENSVFHFKTFPKEIFFALENMNLDDLSKEIKTLLEEKTIKKVAPNNYDNLTSLMSMQTGALSYNKDIGKKLVYNPSVKLLDGNFELGFYFPFNMVPYTIMSQEIFFRVNRDNNEWSFGTDQNSVEEMVLDIFDDTFLKVNKIKYTYKDMFNINYGDYFNVSDFLDFSMVNFNSKIFYPMERKSSFAFNLNIPWFETTVYAENVLPKGIYGVGLTFMTPYKSFRAKLSISDYIDCYDLMHFDKAESYFPMQLNATLDFDVFNLPSFGFSIYGSGGVFFPFSYKNDDHYSTFQDLLIANPNVLGNSIAVNVGFIFRAVNTTISGEFIFDSGLNKIGLYDSYYLATRERQRYEAFTWMDTLSRKIIDASDYNYGGRLRIKYFVTKYVDVEASYQITGPKYFDKLFVKVGYDSGSKYKLRHQIYSEWVISNIFKMIGNAQTLVENNVFYIGYTLSPFEWFDFNINLGMFPDFVYTYKMPMNNKFTLDCYITIKPITALFYMKNQPKKRKAFSDTPIN